MIILGVILIILASVLELKPPGLKVMMTCGVVLLILGVILLVAPSVIPTEHRVWIW